MMIWSTRSARPLTPEKVTRIFDDHVTVLFPAEKFEACKNAKFPLCLERSLIDAFSSKEVAVTEAVKSGFRNPAVSTSEDVWGFYLDLLSSLSKAFGRDIVAAIESKTLDDMKSMLCTKCPLYELEKERKMDEYNNPLPSSSSFLQRNRK
jgi:hypothetical protein